MANENTKVLEKGYKIWHESKGESVDYWMSLMEEDVHFGSLAQGCTGLEFTRSRVNKREVASYFQGLVDTYEMIHYTVDQFVTEEDTVVMVGSTYGG